jgi:hypothetical protein
LASELALLLHAQLSLDVHVNITTLTDDSSGRVVVIFAAYQSGETLIRGTQVVSLLQKKLASDSDVMEFRVLMLNTLGITVLFHLIQSAFKIECPKFPFLSQFARTIVRTMVTVTKVQTGAFVRHFGWRISLVLHLEAPAIVVG